MHLTSQKNHEHEKTSLCSANGHENESVTLKAVQKRKKFTEKIQVTDPIPPRNAEAFLYFEFKQKKSPRCQAEADDFSGISDNFNPRIVVKFSVPAIL